MSDHEKKEIAIAQFIVDELDHFASHYHVRSPRDHNEFLSGQHYQSMSESRTAELALSEEPFVGYALVHKPDKEMRLLICRHYTPLSLVPQNSNTYYASYLSPMGQIVAIAAGGESGYWRLIEKSEFNPICDISKEWDAVDCRIDLIGFSNLIKSMRALIRGQVQGLYQREFRYKVQLPSQAILDAVQDEIFRTPMNRFVRISGAPGTGKTTVLLKRLSQKTKYEFLTADEKALFRSSGYEDGKQWMLFSPSDLLKSYLKEALAKELLPASDEHVKVYGTFRLEVLRDMGFIRVGSRGYFRMSSEKDTIFLKNTTNKGEASLSCAFGEFLKQARAQLVRDTMLEFKSAIRIPLEQLPYKARDILNDAVDKLSKVTDDVERRSDAQRRVADYRLQNTIINDMVQRVCTAVDSYSIDLSALPAIIEQSSRMIDDAKNLAVLKTPETMFSAIPAPIEVLAQSLRTTIGKAADFLSISNMFRMIVPAYSEFRELPENMARYFLDACESEIKNHVISEPELDILLLHALTFIHTLSRVPHFKESGISGELKVLLACLRPIIMIDEATDFSALELACMERFALPQQGGVTISGDLMQRVTERGLRTWDDMSSVCHIYETKDLITGYRQTQRLFSIAKVLCEHVTGSQNNFQSAYAVRETDPSALSFRSTAEALVEDWLTDRICEIFALSENHLPTTAVLVPNAEDVASLYKKLRPLLRKNGLQLDASHSGQTLGDTARVRIFPVEYIKGLEFEAVFYVGLDRMEEIHKDLLDRYVYVGLSRARSFLGVTYEKQFPQRLKCIESHFEYNGSWGVFTDRSDVALGR